MITTQPGKTIDQLFESFHANREARLSPKTYDRYEGIIHFFGLRQGRRGALLDQSRRARSDLAGAVPRRRAHDRSDPGPRQGQPGLQGGLGRRWRGR
jgi:hypothetical protein